MQTHETIDLSERLREQEEHLPACPRCGWSNLYVVEERPDPNFGALGLLRRTLKCAECGMLSVS